MPGADKAANFWRKTPYGRDLLLFGTPRQASFSLANGN